MRCKYFRKDNESCRVDANSCPYEGESNQCEKIKNLRRYKRKKGEKKKRKIFAVYFRGDNGNRLLQRVNAFTKKQACAYVAWKRGDSVLINQMVAEEVVQDIILK